MDWAMGDSLKARSYGQSQMNEEDFLNNGGADFLSNNNYSVSNKNKADDWETLTKKQAEFSKKHELDELRQSQNQKKKYYSVLERQKYEKMQEKIASDQLKQRELAEMQERQKALEKAAVLEAEQKQKYLDYVNQTYRSSLEYKREKDKERREAEVEEERERLKKIQRDLKEEQARNETIKRTFVREAEEVANHKKMLKDFEKVQKEEEKTEYQTLAKQNYEREVERENNYKNYFKTYENDMTERIANHMKYVTTAEIQKQVKLNEIEENNVQKYNEYLKQKEEREKTERLQKEKEFNQTNKSMIDQIVLDRMSKRERYFKMVQERKREEDKYKEEEQKKLNEEEEKRKLYREALEYQKNMQEFSKNNVNRMTEMERKFNHGDIGSGKQKKVEFQGMIPGIYNIESIGSKPTLRRANDDNDDTTSYNALASRQHTKSYRDLRSSVKPLEDFTKFNKPAAKDDKYNPITNPVPFFNQNPYISREKSMIGGSGAGSILH